MNGSIVSMVDEKCLLFCFIYGNRGQTSWLVAVSHQHWSASLLWCVRWDNILIVGSFSLLPSFRFFLNSNFECACCFSCNTVSKCYKIIEISRRKDLRRQLHNVIRRLICCEYNENVIHIYLYEYIPPITIRS